MRRTDFVNESICAAAKSGLHNVNSLRLSGVRAGCDTKVPARVSRGRGSTRMRVREIFNLLQRICARAHVISGHFVTSFARTWHTHTHAHTMVPLWIKKAYSLLLFCSTTARGDTSLVRNEAGGIRFSSVQTARAENDVQNYFRGNDPFPTAPFPSSLPFPSLLMEIITACSLFAPFKGWDLIYRKRWARVRKR